MVLERENCQHLVTGEMVLVRKRKELRVTARFWLGNQWTKPSSPMRQNIVRTGRWFEEKGEVMNLV